MRSLDPLAAWCLALSLAGFVSACDDDEEPPIEPDFPADYASHYTEVRDCRGSGDHDLHNIRILVDNGGVGPYQERNAPFPVGAVVLKEEYDFGDTTCEGEILEWTVMRRLPEGSSPETLDWHWQQVDASRKIVAENTPRCIGCHQACGIEPDGYQGTCAMP